MPRRPRQSRNNAQRGIRLADSDKQLIQASFGAVVQALVRQSGHTNKQLAGATGIPVATLQRLLIGAHGVGLHNIYRLADVLGVPPGELVRLSASALEDANETAAWNEGEDPKKWWGNLAAVQDPRLQGTLIRGSAYTVVATRALEEAK